MLKKWKKSNTTTTKLAVYKTCPVLIVLVHFDYCPPFNVNTINTVHVDDNLASSGRKKWTASCSSTLMAELD